MEYQKIKVPRFITKKWIEVHDQSNEICSINKQIRFKTPMLRSDLCDYSDAYIVVKRDFTFANPNNNAYDKKIAFENNAPFNNCIIKINNNAEDLDVVMPMYNLIEYSKNDRKTTGSLSNYYRDEPNSGAEGNINYSIKKSFMSLLIKESFNYKTSITGKLEDDNVEKDDIKMVVPLKYLSNFRRILDIPLINSEVSLTLTWSDNCVIRSKTKIDPDPDANPAVDEINAPKNATFKIKDTKLYVPVVTLSTENDSKHLEQLKTILKRTIKWNKYRSEMSNQAANNNFNYLIDPTFTNVNRLFVLSFENEEDRKIDFNILIDGKPFFEIPVKNIEEAYEAIIEMSKNNDYSTSNLLDYEYFKGHYKLIAIDLSKQIELENPDLKQQINFIGSLEEDATMFFIIQKKEETTFDFSQNSVTVA